MLLFTEKKGFDNSCKLLPKGTIYMKCQSLFSGKRKENIISLLSAELTQRVVMVNTGLGIKQYTLFNLPVITAHTY